MAGYCEYSKSNSAIDAENRGLETASRIAKRIGHGATAAAVAGTMEREEWHHTSKRYNPVNYYDPEKLDADMINSILIASRKNDTAITLTDASVEWLEWGGTRKHPKADVRTATGCRIEYTGGRMVTITLTSGRTMKKGLTTTGFKINGTYPETALGV